MISYQTALLLVAAVATTPVSSVTFLLAKNGTSLGIYDGSTTTIQKHPYVADLYVQGYPLCTATIVSDSWIITPAYCAVQVDATATILTGSTDGATGKMYPVTKVVVHPNYDPNTNPLDYNYGLVQVKGKFKWSSKTKAIKLAKNNPRPGTKVVVSGYGDSSSNGPILQGTMLWQTKKECTAAVATFNLPYTNRMACAYNKGKVTLCPGDAGDPFVVKNVFYGLALSVAGDVCASDAGPSILADIPAVAPWIKKVTGAKFEDE